MNIAFGKVTFRNIGCYQKLLGRIIWKFKCGITDVGNLAGLVLFVFELEPEFLNFLVAFNALSGQQVSQIDNPQNGSHHNNDEQGAMFLNRTDNVVLIGHIKVLFLNKT